jgi:hypothetical protein
MIASWAAEEVGTADLGDARLDARFALLVDALGKRPNLSIPAACRGRAEMTAAYRFFDNDAVTFDKVLQPHIDQTRVRLEEQQVVLLVQDTTEADLTRPARVVDGVGELDGARRGFLLHETQAFTPEGTPLGTVWAEILNRTEGVSHASHAEKARKNKHTPIEAKESLRWLTGLRKAREVAEQLPGVQCVSVGDSEADIYELFAEPRGALHVLIRACQDRAVYRDKDEDQGGLLRAKVLAAPVLHTVELSIRGRTAKTAAEDRGRRQNRDSRKALVEVRAATVTLRPPWRCDRVLPPVTVNVVLVREPHPPADEPPVEWMLVTTLPIDTPEQVRTIVAYYCVRWCIELFHPHCTSNDPLYRGRFAA